MKKTLVLGVLLLGSVASAETYTWVGRGSDTQWNTPANWVDSSGETPESLPSYTTEGHTYIIGDNATVTATDVTAFAPKGNLIVGDNVKMGGTYAFGATNITIGKNFTWTATSGDGLTFVVGAGNKSDVPNKLTLDSAYTWKGQNLLRTMYNGSVIDFKTGGQIVTAGGDCGQGRAITMSATVGTCAADIVTRWLITGDNIWYRDITNTGADNYSSRIVDYASSEVVTTIDGLSMTKYDFVTNVNAAWTIGGEETAIQNGAYRFVATKDKGIGIQYYAVPEPATATLSLLALAGLAARRRRH